MAACLALRPPPVADFWNSYLDEWLKLRHSQQESHHSYLRKNGIAVIFWCIAYHPTCKRDSLADSSVLLRPSLPLRWLPEELPWVIDQVPWHHLRHAGCLPTQPHSGMLIWWDQSDRRNKGGLLHSWSMATEVRLLRAKSSNDFTDKAYCILQGRYWIQIQYLPCLPWSRQHRKILVKLNAGYEAFFLCTLSCFVAGF